MQIPRDQLDANWALVFGNKQAAPKVSDSETDCERCNGAGWLWRHEIDPDGHHESAMAGYSDDTQYSCPDCHGSGKQVVITRDFMGLGSLVVNP
jgi:DnaJ-class molecular chaperone